MVSSLRSTTATLCDCHFCRGMMLPFMHILKLRRTTDLPLFESSLCGGKDYFLTDHPVFSNSTSVRLPSVCHTGQLQPHATPQSQHQKHKMAFHVSTQLTSVASEACGHRFENRMLNLSTLLSRWTNGEEISAVDEHVETATNVPHLSQRLSYTT